MKKIIFILLIWIIGLHAKTVTIQLQPDAEQIESLAANELKYYLGKIYPHDSFQIQTSLSGEMNIILGVFDRLNQSGEFNVPENPEGFLIQKLSDNKAVITSRGETGIIYGVYQLLEKLGCGFSLSMETLPKPYAQFNLNNWDLTNEPLFPERYVFNWHNFLSGCTGWDFEQWRDWIINSQKMGYNMVMVHAYGNNPMFDFTMNSESKPVGYLTSSVKGRDWSTDHVNDVRRLPGGDVFTDRVFGSKAAKVPDNERVRAKQNLMKNVFKVAENRGMKLNFALDFDVLSNIPQNVVLTLPEKDRFLVKHEGLRWMNEPAGAVWLVRPDTPGGYNYYKTQVVQLFNLYPEIDELTLWRRTNGTAWLSVDAEDLPVDWLTEYKQFADKNADIDTLDQFTSNFAIAKLVDCYRKVLDEIGHKEVQLSMGTWTLKNLKVMDRILPDYLKLIRLDSDILPWRGDWDFQHENVIKYLGDNFNKGRVQPVIWAHHDDGTYYGSPLGIFENFSDKLEGAGAYGFGIIHWMTRPLDLFFVNHSKQTWQMTRNESLKETCDLAAKQMFGDEYAESMSIYLQNWYNKMPSFGRETSPHFIDRPLDYSVMDDMKKRIEYLKAIDVSNMDSTALDFYRYFSGLESWTLFFYQTQQKYEQTKKLLKDGDAEKARQVLVSARPKDVLKEFSRFIQYGGANKGEKGLLFSMGMRWLPHFTFLRQQLRLEPVCYNFGVTLHDDLAQGQGKNTYFIDQNHVMWKTLGAKETGLEIITTESANEINNKALVILPQKVLNLSLWNGLAFSPGVYEIEFISQKDSYPEIMKTDKTIPISINDNVSNKKMINVVEKGKILLKNNSNNEIQLAGLIIKPVNE